MATKLTRSNNVVWEELGNEVLLVSSKSGARWLLNAASAALWKLCDGTASMAEMAAKSALPAAAISEFCGTFEREGLLQASQTSERLSVDTRISFHGGANVRILNLGSGGRRRPSPRGISGPA